MSESDKWKATRIGWLITILLFSITLVVGIRASDLSSLQGVDHDQEIRLRKVESQLSSVIAKQDTAASMQLDLLRKIDVLVNAIDKSEK